MLQLDSKTLPLLAQQRLDTLQGKVDAENLFARKVKKAQVLWDSKSGSGIGKRAFQMVKDTLAGMCVSVEICNYCEQNEANDIEHIYPKSLFPHKTFQWDNYLLACKQCNTAFKLDQFAVLDSNDNAVVVPRNTEPPSGEGAFINPREDDPADYMLMNTQAFRFEILPGIDKKKTNKAITTIEILQLNDRDTLVAARKAAAIYFFQRMELLVRILNAGTVAEIQSLLTPYDNLIDDTQAIVQIKEQIKTGFKRDIQGCHHPSVWFAIKTIDRITDQRWSAIFRALPEALDW